MPPEISRRAALHAAAAAWLSATDGDLLAALTAGEKQGVLTPVERTDLEALAALILPTDDSPGAREAHVIRFIEGSLSTFASDQLPIFRTGLAELRVQATRRRPPATSFAQLSLAAQRAIVSRLDQAKSPFFEAARAATVLGMFSHPRHGGNAGKVGWRLLGFQDRGTWQAPFGDYDRTSQ